MNLKLEVLISCMFQNVKEIITKTNIQTDVLIVNQCNEDRFEEFYFKNQFGNECHARIIHTQERGLSRSRNMALKNSLGDVVLLCDDDECLVNDYENIILDNFKKFPSYDIIAFNFIHPYRSFSLKTFDVGYLQAPKLASWQLAIHKNKKLDLVNFCEKMGSGTGNGGGEEIKFIIDCLKNKCRIKYIPTFIGKVAQTESMWFNGYNRKYWVNRGWESKMIFGYIIGYLYLWYTCLLRAWKIDNENNIFSIIAWMHKGFTDKR